MKQRFYISFGLGTIHRNSYAVVTASDENSVREYASKGLFPGWCSVYSEAEWNTFDWPAQMTQIPATEELL